jgi:PAS domain S-box-containing protein
MEQRMEPETAASPFLSKNARGTSAPDAPVTDAHMRTALNFIMRDTLPPVSAGLGALYTVFAISHALYLADDIALPMSLVAAGTAMTLFVIRLFLGRTPLPEHWVYPLAAIIYGLALSNSLLHLYLSSEPIQTTNLVLLVISAGFLLLSITWLGWCLLMTLLGWLGVAWTATPSPEWTHFGFALFTACVLAVLIQLAKVRTLKRVEGLHFQNARRKAELETALALTDEARQAAEASKRDFMQSEARLRMLTTQMPAVLWTTDTDLRFTSSLGMGLTALALRPNEVLGKTLFEYFQTEAPDFLPIAAHYRALQGISVTYETQWNGRLFDSKVEPLHDADGNVIGVIGIALDITERKQVEERVKVSLQEKEKLLKEIHNRVKNNLQVISSLLNLQAGYIKDEYARARFNESRDRLKAMVLIHEKLYQSEDLTSIDFGSFIRHLAVHLFRSHQVNANDIALHLDVPQSGISLDIDRAMPCGLIINELVANSLQYAFPKNAAWNGATGEIRIAFHEDERKQITITVSDNGVGLPPDLNFRRTESLGFQLINTLADQIQGAISLDRNGGTKFTIAFQH